MSKSAHWLYSAWSEVGPNGTPVRHTYFGTWWMSTRTFGVILRLCVCMAFIIFPWIRVYHFQILGFTFYRKLQPRQDEESRNIQPLGCQCNQINPKKGVFQFVSKRDILDSMAVLPKTKHMRCKLMISLKSEGHQNFKEWRNSQIYGTCAHFSQ